VESSKYSDSMVAGMMAGAVDRETLTSLWSSFITPQSTPCDTLKDFRTPGYTPPEILPKTVSFPRDGMEGADYTVLSQLGEGGMGVVFEARQNHLDRTVALKMIRSGRAGDPLARACFFYEAVITAGLEHPGIVPVLEFGRDQDGRDFYVMKKATGVPWSRVIRDKTLEDNLAIFDRVADVVGYAHTRGIIHRDLKPSNVLLGDFGEVWVGDWGVAVACGPDGTFRHAHTGGTPGYMAPEMALGDAGSLGPRSDVYLLGAILHEIIAGTPPHAADNALTAILEAATNGVVANGNHPLTKVVRKALADSPEDRHASVGELRDAIGSHITMDLCQSHIDAAETLYEEAVRKDGYALFQKTITEYDAALATDPDSQSALRGKLRTLATYSRKALSNGEYDLALTIIDPAVSSWDEAASLVDAIKNAKLDAVHRKKRASRIQAVIFGTAVILVSIAVALYTHSQNRLDRVDDRLREGDTAGRENSSSNQAVPHIDKKAGDASSVLSPAIAQGNLQPNQTENIISGTSASNPIQPIDPFGPELFRDAMQRNSSESTDVLRRFAQDRKQVIGTMKPLTRAEERDVRRKALAALDEYLPGGRRFNFSIMIYEEAANNKPTEKPGVSLEVQRRQRKERETVLKRLTVLLEPVKAVSRKALWDLESDDCITAVYQQLAAIRPLLRNEAENIDELAHLQALSPMDAKRLKENLLYLANVPEKFDLSERE